MQRPGDRHRLRPMTFRLPEDLRTAFKRKVADEGRTITEVLTRLIRRYVEEDD